MHAPIRTANCTRNKRKPASHWTHAMATFEGNPRGNLRGEISAIHIPGDDSAPIRAESRGVMLVIARPLVAQRWPAKHPT